MTLLMVPELDDQEWPSLGGQVCDWIEDNLVFGPGDLRGEPAVLDDEKRFIIWRLYEVYPDDHELAGRRRFKRAALSVRKGWAKTELSAWVAAAELHPDAPVRCQGFNGLGLPIGGPVRDPYIPLVAYTEEQSDELAYGALKAIIEESPIADNFDIGLERIMRIGGDGKAVSLASAPNARDGARTTFQVFDETHWYILPRLKLAHQTMRANLPKRRLADAWALETTTAFEPGAGSVAEDTHNYAKAVDAGEIEDAQLFYFHRSASDQHDLETEEGARAAVVEASGPVAEWSDIDSIVEQWRDPTTDKRFWERVWLNRPVQAERQAFDVNVWRERATDIWPVEDGDLITLGFDGAQFRDSTALVGTHVETGFQWVLGLWEQPYGHEGWEAPADEIDEVVSAAFDRYEVWRMYADPPYWQAWLAKWSGQFGDDIVVEWWTNRRRAMHHALENFETAIATGDLYHSGDERLTRHIGNSHRHDLPQLDDQGNHLWLIRKERSDSPAKIDAAMAAVLSWQARTDAVAAGVNLAPSAGLEVW